MTGLHEIGRKSDPSRSSGERGITDFPVVIPSKYAQVGACLRYHSWEEWPARDTALGAP